MLRFWSTWQLEPVKFGARLLWNLEVNFCLYVCLFFSSLGFQWNVHIFFFFFFAANRPAGTEDMKTACGAPSPRFRQGKLPKS